METEPGTTSGIISEPSASSFSLCQLVSCCTRTHVIAWCGPRGMKLAMELLSIHLRRTVGLYHHLCYLQQTGKEQYCTATSHGPWLCAVDHCQEVGDSDMAESAAGV